MPTRVVQYLDEREIRQAIAAYLSRQGSAEFDPADVSVWKNSLDGGITAAGRERDTSLQYTK